MCTSKSVTRCNYCEISERVYVVSCVRAERRSLKFKNLPLLTAILTYCNSHERLMPLQFVEETSWLSMGLVPKESAEVANAARRIALSEILRSTSC